MLPDELMLKSDLMHVQRVLVTGGGTGLGRVIAEACLMLGSDMHICGRRSHGPGLALIADSAVYKN